MLASIPNVKFDAAVRDDAGTDTYVGHFYFEYAGKTNDCRGECLVAPSLFPGIERIQQDIVEAINQILCKTYTYDQLEDIKPIDPRANVGAAPSLASVITQAAGELSTRGTVPDTWHLVCDEFVKIFAPAVSQQVMQEVVTFFDAVVRKFTHRAYQTGWQEGYKRGRAELDVQQK